MSQNLIGSLKFDLRRFPGFPDGRCSRLPIFSSDGGSKYEIRETAITDVTMAPQRQRAVSLG